MSSAFRTVDWLSVQLFFIFLQVDAAVYVPCEICLANPQTRHTRSAKDERLSAYWPSVHAIRHSPIVLVYAAGLDFGA
jgi:hypothetical protein